MCDSIYMVLKKTKLQSWNQSGTYLELEMGDKYDYMREFLDSDGNVLSPNCGARYMNLCICQNSQNRTQQKFHFSVGSFERLKYIFNVSLLMLWCCLGCTPLFWSNYLMMGVLSRVLELPSKKLELTLQNHSKQEITCSRRQAVISKQEQ